jgi:hypothetical protein
MPGIEELKQKTKLSMDEMYEDESVGKLGKRKVGHPDKQLSSQAGSQPHTHQEINPPLHSDMNSSSVTLGNESGNTFNQPAIQESNQPSIWKTGNPDNQSLDRMDSQITRQPSIYPTKQIQAQKMPTCKMTFNLTEDIYKAFNDLYAKRMLQGRKTEKSELICEAIQWLIKMEEK